VGVLLYSLPLHSIAASTIVMSGAASSGKGGAKRKQPGGESAVATSAHSASAQKQQQQPPAAKKAKHAGASGSAASAAASGAVTPAAAVAAVPAEAPVDLVAGSRKKKRSAHKKSKHILEAAARKTEAAKGSSVQPASMATGANAVAPGEGKAVGPPRTPRAAPAVPGTAKPKAPQQAPAVSSAESRAAALHYLRVWSSDRAAWKFQKVIQIHLLAHLYDKEALPKKEFAIMCEYMKDLKGLARTVSRHTAPQANRALAQVRGVR